jgi:hypothetical protein
MPEQPILAFASTAKFRQWLTRHHADHPGLWLRIAKKASGIPTVTYAAALDEALCLGWIDGQRKAFDEATFSGLPKTGALRRQPVMPCSRICAMSRSSVARSPRERMNDITALLFALVKTSAIRAFAVVCGDLETARGFVVLVRVNPVVETGPLRVARVEFFVGDVARVRAPPRLSGEAFQHTRPAAPGVFAVAEMQAGEGVGDDADINASVGSPKGCIEISRWRQPPDCR